MNIENLEEILKKLNQPKFRLDQIKKAVFTDGVSMFSEISNLPRDLREKLDAELRILSFKAIKVQVGLEKLSAKAALQLSDGFVIETVLLSPKPGLWSVCISTQVGCPMGCAFCATGQGGFKRNLTAEEITDQVLFWKQWLRLRNQQPTTDNLQQNASRITNVVYMGMGEPFLNWEEVKKSLQILTDKDLFRLGSRSISISTVGVPGGIDKLASSFPQVNLAVSLHFCENDKRSRYMPANSGMNLNMLKAELENYFKKCNRKVFLEYTMFRDLNDNLKDARELVELVKSFSKSKLLHVNLIRYNETSGDLKPGSYENIEKFKKYLGQHGVSCTARKSLGAEIQGACGQLAGKE